MADHALALMPFAMARAAADAPHDVLDGQHPGYSIYQTADGALAVAALEPKFWPRFVGAIDCAAIHDDGLRNLLDPDAIGAARLRSVVAERLRTQTTAQWMEVLGPLDCCVSPVLTPQQAMQRADDHKSRAVVHIDTIGQAVIAAPLSSASPSSTAAPALGAHNGVL